MASRWNDYPPYVPVAKRKKKNESLIKKLKGEGHEPQPIVVFGKGRKIARSFWGNGWITHLESFSDYSNRLPRGRSYLRHGAVVDLQIEKGAVTALVSGSDLYRVEVSIKTLEPDRWNDIRTACSGQIGSVLELLQGKLSDEVMSVVVDRRQGLLPLPGEISLGCTCPDWAVMCKHVAAVLFGVGVRLDDEPELLFLLRGVDPQELIAGQLALPANETTDDNALDSSDLADIFGIELDETALSAEPAESPAEPVAHFLITGPAITALRHDYGLTVEELADVLDTSVASVYRWEKSPGELRMREIYRNRLRHLADIRAEILEGRFLGVPSADSP